MKFYDIDTLSKKTGINNKYLLTNILAARARKLSEEKSNLLENEGDKYISLALEDLSSRVLTEEGQLIQEKSEGTETFNGECIKQNRT